MSKETNDQDKYLTLTDGEYYDSTVKGLTLAVVKGNVNILLDIAVPHEGSTVRETVVLKMDFTDRPIDGGRSINDGEMAVKALQHLGWDGDDLSELADQGVKAFTNLTLPIRVKHSVNNGKTYQNINVSIKPNPLGRLGKEAKEAGAVDLKAATALLRSHLKKAGGKKPAAQANKVNPDFE